MLLLRLDHRQEIAPNRRRIFIVWRGDYKMSRLSDIIFLLSSMYSLNSLTSLIKGFQAPVKQKLPVRVRVHY